MSELPADVIARNPGLQFGLTVAGTLCFIATASLFLWIITCVHRRSYSWNHLPALPLPVPIFAAFFPFLALVVYSLGGLSFPVATLIIVLTLMQALRLPLELHYGLKRFRWSVLLGLSLWIGVGMYMPMQGIAFGVQKLYEWRGIAIDAQPAVRMFMEANSPGQLVGLLLLASVLAPLSEEVLFRGFLQPALKVYFPGWGSLVATAFIFGAMHGHGPSFVPLFLLGVILGAVYEMTGSLPLCIGMHATFNGITAAMILTLKHYT